MKEKRRPSLEELSELPRELWELELSQILTDAEAAGQAEIAAKAQALFNNSEMLTPETLVALWAELRGTGSTDAAGCGTDEMATAV